MRKPPFGGFFIDILGEIMIDFYQFVKTVTKPH